MAKRVFRKSLIMLTLLSCVMLYQCGNVGDDGGDDGGNSAWTCQDDDLAKGIYRACNYFPLDTGNIWTFNPTWNVTGNTHKFSTGTAYEVTGWSNPCDDDIMYMSNSKGGLKIPGGYKNGYYKFPNPFPYLNEDMQIGDIWTWELPNDGKITITFVGLEDVVVAAGAFPNCLKVKYHADDLEPGEIGNYWENNVWFAKDVGAVKIERIDENPPGYTGCMQVDSTTPLLELQSATIDGVFFP